MSLEMAFFVRLRHKQAKKMRPAVDQYMATNTVFSGVPFMVTDLRTYRRMDGWTEIRTDGRTDRRVDPLTNSTTIIMVSFIRADGQADRRTGGRTDRQVDERTGGQTNFLIVMNGRIGQTKTGN